MLFRSGRPQGGRSDRPRDDRPRDERPREDRGGWIEEREPGDPSRIPNPLQQTFDRRQVQRERSGSRDVDYENFIPNPLQQTYDKRAVQGDRGLGLGKRGKPGKGGGAGAGGQPDPMRTSVGYIGADAFAKKMQGRGGGGGGGGNGGGRRRR